MGFILGVCRDLAADQGGTAEFVEGGQGRIVTRQAGAVLTAPTQLPIQADTGTVFSAQLKDRLLDIAAPPSGVRDLVPHHLEPGLLKDTR